MKKIGIDLDSTLNNLTDVWVDLYNKDYNDNLKYFLTWDSHNDVKPECGRKIYDYLLKPQLFFDLDINPNAQEIVNFLSKHYKLYIITAYIPSSCVDKVNWVRKYLPELENDIVFINDKSILELDYLIDDGPHNLKTFKGTGIVYDRQYNKYLGDKYPRVNNWKDVEMFFTNELIKDNRKIMKRTIKVKVN